ncbi:MAG: 6-phosphogluconolactonase [Vulcanimicrobiaceae bacterium]
MARDGPCIARTKRSGVLRQRYHGDLKIYEDAATIATVLADLFVDEAQTAIADRGGFYVALAGGSTPRAAYALLAEEPRNSQTGWKDVFIYFGDERCVPPDDEQSNYKMASDTFLSKVNIPESNVHRMHGEEDPETAAAEYARILREDLGEALQFDLIMLGMGADGHTASLFPGTDPLADADALVRAPYVDRLGTRRLTITPRVINSARHVVIATEGLQKAPALAAVLEGPYDPVRYPIQVVSPSNGRLTWLVDADAAAELKTKP